MIVRQRKSEDRCSLIFMARIAQQANSLVALIFAISSIFFRVFQQPQHTQCKSTNDFLAKIKEIHSKKNLFLLLCYFAFKKIHFRAHLQISFKKIFFIFLWMRDPKRRRSRKKLNFIISHRIADSRCVRAWQKCEAKSAANEFKAFLWREWIWKKKLAYYLNISCVCIYLHIAICSFLYTIFFLRGPTKHHHQQHWTCGDSLTYTNIFFLILFLLWTEWEWLYVRLYTIIKSKCEKEKQRKKCKKPSSII